MAVTDITVYQDNFDGAINLLAVHSPLVFLIDVTYSGAAPSMKCDLTIDGITPINEDATFNCVFHEDVTNTIRRYRFQADVMIRGFMSGLDDFVQTDESVEQVRDVQQAFTLVFYDSDVTLTEPLSIIAFAAKRQFGESPALSEIYNNEDDLYIAGSGMPVYIYFFNDTLGSDATITDGTNEYELATGGEDTLDTETMDDWQGSGNETSPLGWDLSSTQARSTTWRIYEQSSGIGLLTMQGAINGDYFALRNDSITWTKGETVYLRIRYQGSAANVYIGAIEKALYGAVLAGGGTHPLPYAASYAEIEIPFTVFNADWILPGPRCPQLFIVATGSVNVSVYIDTITIYKPASAVGYYRLMVSSLTVDTVFSLMDGLTELASKTVRVKPFCTNSRYLKYLDRNGQYRFFPFNEFWQAKDTPKLIGKTNRLITSILLDSGSHYNVGYTNERKLTLVADDVTADELDLLSDIYTSPRVYLLQDTKWISVEVTASEALVRRKKGASSKIELTVTLPEWYNITMM